MFEKPNFESEAIARRFGFSHVFQFHEPMLTHLKVVVSTLPGAQRQPSR